MLDNVETHCVFSEEEIKYLKNEFDRGNKIPTTQWENITNIFITPLENNPTIRDHFAKKLIAKTSEITSKQWKINNCFLLEYHPGGEAKLHRDNHAVVGGVSLITLIDQEDLQGGDILIQNNDHTVVIKQQIGDTTFYKADVVHGVSKVITGYRQVFVTWLDPKEE